MQKTALYKALGLTLSAVLISACSSNADKDAAAEQTAIEQQAAEQEAMAAEKAAALEAEALAAEARAAEKLEAQARAAEAALRKMTVFYFDFDQSTLKDEGKEALKAHAAYLAANPSASVVLEGYTDDRGTVEYNLALGERRGMAVRRFLMANDASASQLDVVSFGEEDPAMLGNNAAAWAKNRRVEIKYQSR